MLAVPIIVVINIPKSGLLSTFPTRCGVGCLLESLCPVGRKERDFIAGTMTVLLVNNLQAHGPRRARSCVL